jgi:phage shock protein E
MRFVVLLAGSLALAACGGSAVTDNPPLAAAGAAAVTSGAPTVAVDVLLDVRTAEEFADGHLDGAVNLSILDADFLDRVAQLDRSVSYGIYCRSGNRSAAALEAMRELGFTDLVDLGSVAAAATAVGVDVVR